jgi:hypothetical protein
MLLFPNSIRLNGSAFSGLGEPHKGYGCERGFHNCTQQMISIFKAQAPP